MSKEQAIEELIEQVNHNMDTFVGLFSIALVFFLYFQWRLSKNQIQKLKYDVKNEILKEYHLEQINGISKTDEALTNLILVSIRNVTNYLMFDNNSYTTILLTDKFINIIGYLDVLKGRKVSNADFIDEIAQVFVMIDGWVHRNPQNKLEVPASMYIYKVYIELTNKTDWQNVEGYDHAIKELKDKIRPLKTFDYINVDDGFNK